MTSSTCMSAPNRPVATGTPSSAQCLANVSTTVPRLAGGGGTHDPAGGPLGVAVERELAHDEHRATGSCSDRFILPSASSNARRFATFSASFRLSHLGVLVRHTHEHASPDPDLPTTSPSTRHRAWVTRPDERPHVLTSSRIRNDATELGPSSISASCAERRSFSAPAGGTPSAGIGRSRPRPSRRSAPGPATRGRTRTTSATGAGRACSSRRGCAVASSSPWPPDRNTMPGTAAGTSRGSTRSSRPQPSRRRLPAANFLPGNHHVRLEQHALERTRCANSWSNTACNVRGRDCRSTLERVGAVHQDFGLDDRDDAFVLAQRRVARERVRVRRRCSTALGMPSPMSITARHFAKRHRARGTRRAAARSPSRPVGDELARRRRRAAWCPCRP